MTDSPNPLLTSNLLVRTLSSIVLIPVVLGAVWVGNWVFFALILAVCGIGMHEWLGLTAPNLPPRARIVTLLSLLLVFLAAALKGVPQAFGLSILASIMLWSFARKSEPDEGNRPALWAAIGLPYLALAGMAMLALRDVPERGFGLTVFLLLAVWATDIGAYFAGRLIGGPKLLPSISPKKTWAGLIGGMVFAGIIGYGVSLGFGESDPLCAGLVGMALAVVAQAGDFFESYVKRRAGAKDSGTLIPGHGGVLDRVDGLLTAVLLLAALQWFWG